MTLWLIFHSPLMMGGDLPSNDDFTLSLLTNPEALAIHRSSAGNHELFARGNQIAWVADVPGTKDKYVAVFNLDDHVAAEALHKKSSSGPVERRTQRVFQHLADFLCKAGCGY